MSEMGDGYRAAVAEYLLTSVGSSTPEVVAVRLASLDPYSVGLTAEPSGAQLHATRIFLESISPAPGEAIAKFRGVIHQMRNGTR